jgi:hypothetical protein
MLPFTYLLFSIRTTSGFQAYFFPTLGLVATFLALFTSIAVSAQAFVAGLILNVILVATILRIGSILADITLFAFLFQLSLVFPSHSF